jgi:hypothetical protein
VLYILYACVNACSGKKSAPAQRQRLIPAPAPAPDRAPAPAPAPRRAPAPAPAPAVVKPATLSAALAAAHLSQYEDALRALGCAEPADLADCEEADMMELGMKKMEIKRLKRNA